MQQPSGTFADFMEQLPPQIIAIFILFTIMLVISLTLIVVFRLRKNRATSGDSSRPGSNPLSAFMGGGAAQPPAARTAPTAPPADMPDLDMLLAFAPDDPDEPPAAVHAQAAPPDETPAAPIDMPPTPRQGAHKIRLSSGRTTDATTVMVVSRDLATDNLIVQIGGHAYDGTEASIDATFSRRYAKTLRELAEISPVLGNGDAKAPPKAAPPPPAPTPAKADNNKAPAAPLDLAGQIEAYLQEKLTETEAFPGRAIHIGSKPSGEVEIEVDGELFGSVGEVSDAEVRSFLSRTIAEWQASKNR